VRLAEFLAWAEVAGFPEAAALAARLRALTASGEEADRWFTDALRLHATTDRLLDQARTQLLYGEFLRRARRRVQARPHLQAALDTFEQLGTPLWAERARGELRATGVTTHRRDPGVVNQLTPQELQIMHAVSRGLTNREVAAQLFISPRTVSHHLRKVFDKLGISSRGELIRLALTDSETDQHI
jgi:DNA-binding NarL/FixJ family response regulator